MNRRLPKQTRMTEPATGVETSTQTQPPPPLGREPGVAGWLIDPTRRHQIRYWTGARWTASVSDNGVRTADPLDADSGDGHAVRRWDQPTT
jgi:hypothetical protein